MAKVSPGEKRLLEIKARALRGKVTFADTAAGVDKTSMGYHKGLARKALEEKGADSNAYKSEYDNYLAAKKAYDERIAEKKQYEKELAAVEKQIKDIEDLAAREEALKKAKESANTDVEAAQKELEFQQKFGTQKEIQQAQTALNAAKAAKASADKGPFSLVLGGSDDQAAAKTAIAKGFEAMPEAQVSPSGYDYSHGVALGSGQILWNDGKKWVAKNQNDFFGKGGQLKSEYIPQIRKALADAGYRAAGSLVELTTNWRDLVASTGGAYSPLEAKKWAGEFLGGTGGLGGGAGTPKTTTFKNVQTVEHTPQTIKDVANAVAQKYLGRDLAWDDIVKLTQEINAKEAKSPSVTSGKTTGGVGTSSTTQKTSGGFTPETYLKTQLMDTQESQNYRKATMYYDTMLQTLAGKFGSGI